MACSCGINHEHLICPTINMLCSTYYCKIIFLCRNNPKGCRSGSNCCIRQHIGPVAHFVDVGVTRNVKGCQKLQSGWPTHFVDQHICWCGWCSVTVQFVVSGLPIDTICWSGDVFRINILRKRPILLVHLINIHNGYAFRNNILCLQNQHSVPSESTFCALRINILVWHPSLQYIIIIIVIITIISGVWWWCPPFFAPCLLETWRCLQNVWLLLILSWKIHPSGWWSSSS